jgi:hypothetical protein
LPNSRIPPPPPFFFLFVYCFRLGNIGTGANKLVGDELRAVLREDDMRRSYFHRSNEFEDRLGAEVGDKGSLTLGSVKLNDNRSIISKPLSEVKGDFLIKK